MSSIISISAARTLPGRKPHGLALALTQDILHAGVEKNAHASFVQEGQEQRGHFLGSMPGSRVSFPDTTTTSLPAPLSASAVSIPVQPHASISAVSVKGRYLTRFLIASMAGERENTGLADALPVRQARLGRIRQDQEVIFDLQLVREKDLPPCKIDAGELLVADELDPVGLIKFLGLAKQAPVLAFLGNEPREQRPVVWQVVIGRDDGEFKIPFALTETSSPRKRRPVTDR